ncbi:DoxX family protein [Nocardia abscessus]|uniref:DoxX family protein n=1 Tax=Nocardia abscessus TaxID=120957 RepID=UPI001895BB8E|nr:DoxX family protein [Nocardia abscessus]MBF6341677.1 DoxX family protein [Nocardia abscessus]
MFEFPEPVWPVVILAFIQFGDALMCIKPAKFIAECFEDVQWPRRYWWMMSPIKFSAAAGLIGGLWIPYLTALTCAALIAYFVIAIGMHVVAEDFGRNLFLNATIMLLICIGAAVLSYGT